MENTKNNQFDGLSVTFKKDNLQVSYYIPISDLKNIDGGETFRNALSMLEEKKKFNVGVD